MIILRVVCKSGVFKPSAYYELINIFFMTSPAWNIVLFLKFVGKEICTIVSELTMFMKLLGFIKMKNSS